MLRMKHTTMDKWRRLPTVGRFVGDIGSPTAKLVSNMRTNADTSWDLQEQCELDATVEAAKSKVEQHLRRSWPLVRRSLDTGIYPTKITGTDKYLPCIQQTMKGWDKEDPHTIKKLLVEVGGCTPKMRILK